MSARNFAKWYMIIFGSLSFLAMFISTGAYEYPLGKALIVCLLFWLFVALLVIIWAFANVRHRD